MRSSAVRPIKRFADRIVSSTLAATARAARPYDLSFGRYRTAEGKGRVIAIDGQNTRTSVFNACHKLLVVQGQFQRLSYMASPFIGSRMRKFVYIVWYAL